MSRLRVSATVALVAALLPAVGMAADPLPGKSPFGPPVDTTKAGAEATASDGDYELMGMVATPKGPMLSIARQGANKGTLWIPVGGSREEITVVSYDARHERAVIRVSGQSRTLTMRKSVIVAGENAASEPEVAPAPEAAPASDAPATETDPAAATETPPADADATAPDATAHTAAGPEPSSPPASDEAAAEEARNLVSDLMDIGQQQRQAYEAAARAAGQSTAEPESTPPADESTVEPTPDRDPAPAGDDAAQPTGSDDSDPAPKSDAHAGG